MITKELKIKPSIFCLCFKRKAKFSCLQRLQRMLAGSTNTAHPVVLHVAGVSGCPDLCAHGPCAPCFDLQDNMPLTVLAPPDVEALDQPSFSGE